MQSPTGSYESLGDASVTAASRCLVFVVEDEEDIARLISHNLQAAGFDVQSFVSGASVISEALREMPSLFLLDVMLPGTDGFDLCRHIRQTPTLSSTPIIFLTAKTAEADRVKVSNWVETTTSPNLSAPANWLRGCAAYFAACVSLRSLRRFCAWAILKSMLLP
jgi:CheY-like chemotaxis protein